jgi:beta-glucosidase
VVSLPSELSIAAKARLVAGASGYATAGLRTVGLEPLRLADGGHGIGGFQFDETTSAICTPCGSGQAATWDPDVTYGLGTLIGAEATRLDVDVVLAPMINIPRSPLGGRTFECYGEDPLLAGTLAAAWIRGVQSAGVAATPKHFVGNDSERARTRVDCIIDECALREIYLLPFELATRGGAWTLMTAYNRVNGTRCSEHAQLLRQVVNTEWGWDGLVMSDWFGAHDTVGSALGGVDLEMPGPPRVFGEALEAAVVAGRVSEERLDEMVARLLRLASRVGRLGTSRPKPRVTSDSRGRLRDACAGAIVLLRNRDNALPLVRRDACTIAVIGPGADDPCFQGGGSSRVHMACAPTPLECIVATYGTGTDIVHEAGCSRRAGPTPLHELDVRAEHPDGRPGLTVEYIDAGAAEPFARELRADSRLVWHDGIPGMAERGGRVRVACEFVPTEDGAHRFTVKSSGSVRGFIAGREVVRTKGAADAGDPFAVLFDDDEAHADVQLLRHVPVAVEIRMDVVVPHEINALAVACGPPEPDGGLARAAAAATRADAVILIVGTGEDIEREGADRTTLRLPGRQEELGRRVIAANPRTIAIVNAGSPVDLRWARGAAALLYAWFLGEELGPALADVLCGDREPGGRLPITLAASAADYPVLDTSPDSGLRRRYEESTLVGYRHFDAHRIQPEFCFGHGHGYTDFAYEAMTLSRSTVEGDAPLTVAITVRNTGSRPGKEVVQLYVAPPKGAAQRPPKELKSFAPIHLGPGAVGTVEFKLGKRAFAHWDAAAGSWTVLSGAYELLAGRSSRDIRLREPVSAESDILLDRPSRRYRSISPQLPLS